jgi:serine/threonine protein kinase/cytochrome c-type biogenesis protein CcmH/NrfG
MTPGTILGRYDIRSKIGEGGMGEVYLAWDTKLDRKVALKILPAELACDQDRMRRFVQEAKAVSALNQPNILTIYEIDEIDSRHFISTEFIEGATLRQHMRSGSMKLGEMLDVAIQITSALAAAHAAGIVHRDIKPENIMIRRDGLVKVLDFGLAKFTANDAVTVDTEVPTRFKTLPGTVLGTAVYMSPEQARGKEVDARTDVWSLAVVIYEMLTGRLPFSGETMSDVLASILMTEVITPKHFNAEIPAGLERMIVKALRKDRKERYQTATDLLIDLRQLKKQLEFATQLKRTGPIDKQGDTKTKTSIAVLPFANMSADLENEYFCDGLAEELIGALTKIENLRVVARTSAFSFKGKEADVREIGHKLNATTLLEGSVRKTGSKLRITVQLVNVSDGYHLWSERYDRPLADVFDIQEEISLAIVKVLKVKLLGEEKADLLKRGTDDAQAYQLYLKGRHYWYKRTEEALRKGIEYFNQAIEQDPGYAVAYAGLSDSYALLALRGVVPPREGLLRARAAARKALEIDDSLAEAYASLAHVRLHDWDWPGLEKEFKRALELNPGHAIAYHWYSEYLMAMGRSDEAIEAVKHAQEIDPLSSVISGTLAIALYFARRYDQAIECLKEALKIDANHFALHFRLGQSYLVKGMCEEAIEEMEKSVTLSGRSTETLAGLGQAYAAARLITETRKVLDQLNELSKAHYVSPYSVAKVYSVLGEKDQAFAWLEKAYEERHPDFIELKVEPLLDILRPEPLFADLVRRVGL